MVRTSASMKAGLSVAVWLRVPSGDTMSCSGPYAAWMARKDAAMTLLDVSRVTGMPPSHIMILLNGNRNNWRLPIQ